MGMGVPLLNEYKRTFLFKRIPQTVLGGLKLRLGYEAPFYVYISQITLWLVPLLLGCIFTVVLELAYTDDKISDFLLLYTCLYGACIVIFVVVIQTISTVVEMKEKESEEHAAAGGMAVVQKKRNLFADEDEVQFESCCGAETLTFVVPPKKFKINIAFHAMLSGLVCGLGFWYLLPYTVNKLYGHSYGATVAIFILGWLTVCITQYSLTTTAPAEPAVYRTTDIHELLPLTRPLYAVLCYAIHVANWYNSAFRTADQVVHVVFVSLPVLWLLGLLPPAQVFILWLLEQVHVWLQGGSPAASTPRLLVSFSLSLGVLAGGYFLGSTFAAVLLAALAGYALSCDLGSLGSQVWASCTHSSNRVSTKKPSPLTQALSAPQPRNTGFLWSWCFSTVLYHLVMLLLVAAAAGVAAHRADALSDWWKLLGYAIIGLYGLEKFLRDSQSVYGGLGLWRNWLYPPNVDDRGGFRAGKKKLLVLGFLRRGLLSWICPLVMVFYLGIMVGADVRDDVMEDSLTTGRSRFSGMCYVLGVMRAFRWTWQSTAHALLEVSLVHAVLVAKPPGYDDLDFPVLLLVVSFGRDRFFQVANKLFFWLAVLVASWTDKKQRRSSTAPIIALNVVLFPAVITIVLAASMLSAPLLCVFTLPVFFIGFPRLGKFWAEDVGASASTCPDTLYYRQLSSEIALALRSAFANGSLGEPHAGNHYLARFQDRLVWVMVLERGASFCTVSIKGLELQETSCHTAEAARIDDQFAEAFTVPPGLCHLNHYPLHCLTPLDTARVSAYSDAKNVLTGVIDAPSAVETTLNFFVKSLVWLLLRHISKRRQEEAEARKRKEREIAEMESESLSADWTERDKKGRKNSPPSDPGRGGGLRKDKISITSGDAVIMSSSSSNAGGNLNVRPFGTKSTKKGGGSSGIVVRPPPPPFGDRAHQVMGALPPINVGNRTSLVHSQQPPRPGSGESRHSVKSRSYSPATASLQSYTDIFSDDEDGGAGDRAVIGRKFRSTVLQRGQQPQHHELSTIVTITQDHPNPLPPSPTSALTSLPPLFNPAVNKGTSAAGDGDASKDLEDLLSESDFGMPAVDINIPHTKAQLGPSLGPPSPPHSNLERAGLESKLRPVTLPAKPFSKLTVTNGNHIFKPVMNLAGSPDFKCQYSSHISIPHKWRELPIEPSQLSRYISRFPTAWYQHVLATLDWSSAAKAASGRNVIEEITQDDTLTNCYSQLVMACFLAFDSSGYHSGAHYLYKCYNGDVPWNAMMDWLAEDKELHSLVIKAFRFSFKLMLDETLLGDISDGDELAECLASLETDWYIGRETDTEWGLAVVDSRKNLFSLGYSPAQSVYTSRTLTLQDLSVAIGRVNREVVTGQWANLNLELLYMTNDDEERYSIQAQPALLRNLTVQAADPPLGYPIYSSPPISIPTL